jgi:hypothetical protein
MPTSASDRPASAATMAVSGDAPTLVGKTVSDVKGHLLERDCTFEVDLTVGPSMIQAANVRIQAHDKSGPLIPASYTTLVEEVARDSCAWLANMLVLVALA